MTTATVSLAGYLSIVRGAGANITPEQETLLGAFAQYLDQHGAPQKAESSAGTPKRPKAGTLTGQVWEVADSLVVDGKAPERKQVREVCKAKGLNEATIDTQWSLWSKAFRAAKAAAEQTPTEAKGEEAAS